MCMVEKGRSTVDITPAAGASAVFAVYDTAGKPVGLASAEKKCRVKGENGERYTIRIL